MSAFSTEKPLSGFLVAPRVPQGLAAAVEGLTREVIRNKPSDIYVFAARHFENLLQLREQYEASTPLTRDPQILQEMGLTHLVSPDRRKTTSRSRLDSDRSGSPSRRESGPDDEGGTDPGDRPEDTPAQMETNSQDPEISPHTYILTEGSPYDIPESVTTVIIPEHLSLPQRDPFGEEIIPEEVKVLELPLVDVPPKKPEIIIPKQNLQCINEEEGLEDEEVVDETGTSDPPTSFLDVEEEGNEMKSFGQDVSEDFPRGECVSMSSTSAKETSATDGPLETPKEFPDSGEDVTSVSVSGESSNEAKETTLTDGTSFSIDPTRPFVPELNLDSLQDITVSSFKMTEDEYEPGDNENTNSFSETLTPDERVRSAGGGVENLEDGGVEEEFVQEFVEVEPPCEKKVAVVLGEDEEHPENRTDAPGDVRCDEKGSESDQGTENLDEETPLAVSRSASQCTTRRVSSGNLVRMKEDLRLQEDEEGKEEGEIEAVGDDAEDDRERMESKEYHIYVPEMDQSEESTTESSFNSAATKIQAGVRGFLTRRRLQRMHHLNSTLNGVPSIQDSIVIDERPLESLGVPERDLEEAATTIQSNFRGYKARKRLRREDAMQRTTISMERAFGEEGLRHTGEFHDCIPLPLLDTPPVIFQPKWQSEDEISPTQQQTLGMMFQIAPGIPGIPVLQFGLPPKITKLVDLVVLAKDETAVESGYLNFITSVEDADTPDFRKRPRTPGSDASGESTRDFLELSPRKGVIIEEITSLEEAEILREIKAKESAKIRETPGTPEIPGVEAGAEVPAVAENNPENGGMKEIESEAPEEEASFPLENPGASGQVLDIAGALEAPLATLGFPMKEGKLLHYGSEDSMTSHVRRPLLEVTLTPGDPMKSMSLSQESQLAGERIESPITMMQIVPGRGSSLLQDDSGEILAGEEKKENEFTGTPETSELSKKSEGESN
ncbi:uncharacterized protein [Fopius arisanus]|uniref:RIIa domain-containing protein n=1 Tax=Fopius arisanus TaxID=64838 RepID=A0A9R1TCP2_9HYME|nr:PREDICTED: uncharacterized protein LOC105268668 [Fopius arisanus]